MTEAIRIEGLREFTRSLKQIDGDLPKAVRLAANRAASIVVDDAKPKVPVGPSAGGHVRNTLKAKSTRTAVRVSGGSKRNPYYGWLDFGGKVGKNRSVSRPFLKSGRFLWASWSDRSDDVIKEFESALVEVVESAGLDVEGE